MRYVSVNDSFVYPLYFFIVIIYHFYQLYILLDCIVHDCNEVIR